ncbi:MAG: hypothetical protein Q9174_006046 [Haloplaca sp. 1 TL-2023]
MASFTRLTALVALLASSASIVTGVATSGSAKTTRYWDCCKPSCAWSDKAGIASPVKTCDIKDKPLSDANAKSGCEGGNSFMCSDQSPWAVNDNLAYGFAAVTSQNPQCCQCYKLTFKDTAAAGKSMIVQITNTGDDVSNTQFDLAVVASAASTPAPANGTPPPPSGANNTAVPAQTPAPPSPPPSSPDAVSAGAG